MDARLSPRRLFTCTAALVAIVAAASGCGGGGNAQAASQKHDPPRVQYSDSVLRFTHPVAWKAYPFQWPGELHFHPLVYLSTQPVHDPCATNGTVTSCGFPVQRLEPGGVLGVWQFVETPITSPIKLDGAPLRVGGHRAGRLESARGECRSIGADRTIEVMTELSHQSLLRFTACLRGPGLARAERRVDALLASTRFVSH